MMNDITDSATLTPAKQARAARTADIVRRRRAGETFQTISDVWGVSRQAIQHTVALHDPTAGEAARHSQEDARTVVAAERAKTAKAEAERLLQERAAYAIEHDLKCRLCGAWLLGKKGNVTCSTEHSAKWKLVKYQVDEVVHARHRLYPSQVTRRPDPDAPYPDRVRWATSPEVRAVLEEFFPEILDGLYGSEGNLVWEPPPRVRVGQRDEVDL